MPKYLVTATAFRESDDNPGAFAPRTFSFEVSLAQPWNGKNSLPVGDAAFHECHRTYGFWPKHNPQIDSVVEIGNGGLPEDLSSRLAAAALMDEQELSDLIVDLQKWDASCRETVETVKPEDPADDDIDELI